MNRNTFTNVFNRMRGEQLIYALAGGNYTFNLDVDKGLYPGAVNYSLTKNQATLWSGVAGSTGLYSYSLLADATASTYNLTVKYAKLTLPKSYKRNLGDKQYELTDHLGNVRAVQRMLNGNWDAGRDLANTGYQSDDDKKIGIGVVGVVIGSVVLLEITTTTSVLSYWLSRVGLVNSLDDCFTKNGEGAIQQMIENKEAKSAVDLTKKLIDCSSVTDDAMGWKETLKSAGSIGGFINDTYSLINDLLQKPVDDKKPVAVPLRPESQK